METQLELADALIQQNLDEVRRLVRETMQTMGITDAQLDDLAKQLRDLGVDPGPLDPRGGAEGSDEQTSGAGPPIDLPADDLPADGLPPDDLPPDDEPSGGRGGDKWGPDQEPPVVGG